MKTNKRYVLLIEILALSLLLASCGSSNGGLSSINTDGIPSIINPVVDQPAAPGNSTQPILVSEPISITIPDSGIVIPETTSDIDLSNLDPVIVGTVEPTATTPAAQIIEATPVVAVVTPSASTAASEPVVVVEAAPVVTTPAAPVVVVAQPVPAPIVAVADAVNNESDTITADIDADDDKGSNEQTEVKLEGSCFNKKKVGFVWFHKDFSSKKKTASVACKNGKYKVRIKVKTKFVKFVKFQTLFFD